MGTGLDHRKDRSGSRTGWFQLAAPALFAACGPELIGPAATREELEVRADPPGMPFEGATWVVLEASRPSAIHYNLEGQDPLGMGSRLYEGPILLERTTLMTFLAIGEDGTWSEPRSELYSNVEARRAPQPVARALEVERDNYFFLAEPGHEEEMTARFQVRSRGEAPVRIRSVVLAVNPRGAGFFEPGVFALIRAPRPLDLDPGETLVLIVSYRPTPTLRSAALIIDSDDEVHREGRVVIELWGRIQSW